MTNSYELKTRDGKAVKDLQTVYACNHTEVVGFNIKDLNVGEHSVTLKSGADLTLFCNQLFGGELFADELTAYKNLAAYHDAFLARERSRLAVIDEENKAIYRKMIRLEEKQSPYLRQACDKSTERVGSIRI